MLEAVEVDLRRPRRLLRLLLAAGAQLAGDPLRIAFERRIRPGRLVRPDIFISTRAAELAPLLPRHGESGAEVGQGDLADLAADALGLNQAVAVGGLAALHVGFRGFNVHGRRFWREKIKNQS